METITGTLIIVPAGNKEKNYKFHTWIKNIKTINEIINLRNNKKIVKELGTKIKKLGQRFRKHYKHYLGNIIIT